MKSNFSFKWRHALLLAIFLFGLLGSVQDAMAQYDTAWTRMTEASIKQVAFHPNSQLIATGNNSSYISIWDVISGNELKRFSGASSNLYVEFTKDGKFLAFGGGYDLGGVKIIDFENQLDYRMLVCPTNSAAFINDSNLIAIGGAKDIRIWDFQKNEVVIYIDSINLPDTGKDYYSLSQIIYSPMNNSIIYTSTDGKLRFYNLNKGIIEFTYNAGYGEIAISNDGNYIAFKTGLSGLAVQIMEVETKQIVKSIPGSPSGINSIVFSPDGKYLAVAYEYAKVLKIWDIQTGNNVYNYIENPARYFNAIDWSKDNQYIVGGATKLFLYKNKMVSVHEGENSYDTLYPNPTTDYITLNVPNNEPIEGIEIFNIFGECVLSVETIHELSLQKLDISSLPAGTYFLRAGKGLHKFMVAR